MENLREQMEIDLNDMIESEFIMPVELTGPDGITQLYSANNIGSLLGGRTQSHSTVVDPETGEKILVEIPVVTLRLSSLNRVPVAGETWFIKIPVSPASGAAKQSYIMSPTRAPVVMTDLGTINIYLQKIDDTEVVS